MVDRNPRGLWRCVAWPCCHSAYRWRWPLFGATLPPEWLWSGEARGYDALEYHLQAPREYFEAGRIHFLPYNVYASFPQQVETFNLLLMHLAGSPLGGAIPAQLLHLAFGVLTVLALAAWAAPGWPRILVVLVAGAVPWLAYLGCLAYVELAMLFFAALAAGLISESYRSEGPFRWQTALTAGLCAGLAGGCKYTALAMVGAALAIAWLLTMRGRPTGQTGPRRTLWRRHPRGVQPVADPQRRLHRKPRLSVRLQVVRRRGLE